jgi:hypothetical protein
VVNTSVGHKTKKEEQKTMTKPYNLNPKPKEEQTRTCYGVGHARVRALQVLNMTSA